MNHTSCRTGWHIKWWRAKNCKNKTVCCNCFTKASDKHNTAKWNTLGKKKKKKKVCMCVCVCVCVCACMRVSKICKHISRGQNQLRQRMHRVAMLWQWLAKFKMLVTHCEAWINNNNTQVNTARNCVYITEEWFQGVSEVTLQKLYIKHDS